MTINLSMYVFTGLDSQRSLNQSSGIERDTVVVKNLPPSITWQELRDKFRNCGDIKFAEIKGKGDIGLVRFDSEWTAKRAIGECAKVESWI